MNKFIKSYYFPMILIMSIISGGFYGYFMGDKVSSLKPLGDIFLNLIFTAIVPLIFFSISSSVARMRQTLWKIMSAMMVTFILTGIIAAIYMISVVKIFPPAQGVIISLGLPDKASGIHIAQQLTHIFTVSDFSQLLSHQNMLALILFSFLVGFSTALAGENGKPFSQFLQSGSAVFMKMINLIMYYAPIGFFAYFAIVVGELGPKIIENYVRATLIYYIAGIFYFIVAYSIYVYLSGKNNIKLFWKNILLPLLTSLATCSSAASIPANLQAAKQMRIPTHIYETVIPIGSMLHKEGSILGAVIKIAFLFGIFHISFSGSQVLIMASLIALLVGTVMGAIPSGGMLGEMLILTIYGFPPQALMMIVAISIIIDPLATMLNVVGNTVSSLLVTRIMDSRHAKDILCDATI